MRKLVAAIAGLAVVVLWIASAMILADHVRAWSWPFQFLYYAIAGTAWVIPVRAIMIWGLTNRV